LIHSSPHATEIAEEFVLVRSMHRRECRRANVPQRQLDLLQPSRRSLRQKEHDRGQRNSQSDPGEDIPDAVAKKCRNQPENDRDLKTAAFRF
jgi:hypothetical protein